MKHDQIWLKQLELSYPIVGKHLKHNRMGRHFITLIILISVSTTCFGQYPVDTIQDDRYSSTAQLTEKLLLEIKSRKFDRLENLVASDWGNKGLFQKNMSEIADSLDRYGIPDKSQLTVTESVISVENNDISRNFVKFTYNINTATYVKQKTFGVVFVFFREGKELDIQDIRTMRPPLKSIQDLINNAAVPKKE